MVDELARRGIPFRGALYAGLILTADRGPVLLEFNARFGDPEVQVLLPLVATPLAPVLLAAALGRLGVLFAFVAVFWSLWDQSGGEWVLQAQKMDLHFLGITWLASQIQAVNAIMILAFIPLFQYVIYPAMTLSGIGFGLWAHAARWPVWAIGVVAIAAAPGLNGIPVESADAETLIVCLVPVHMASPSNPENDVARAILRPPACRSCSST